MRWIICWGEVVESMQPRSAISLHSLVLFCISSLFVLGLFVVPAIAQDTGANRQPADDNASAADAQYNAADAQYADDVIKDTIPNKKILIDTGGASLPMIGGVILAMGLVGLGVFLLRRT
jgi:hypothetical protein